uniref:Putative secreted protein n=1 Tax=Ixodes scapularis TaxID=6945 RepID=A0A4D5RC82_IXOSC
MWSLTALYSMYVAIMCASLSSFQNARGRPGYGCICVSIQVSTIQSWNGPSARLTRSVSFIPKTKRKEKFINSIQVNIWTRRASRCQNKAVILVLDH